MCRKLSGRPVYPFLWLDEIVEITLNPERTNVKALTPEALKEIRERLPAEMEGINRKLKTQAFYLYSTDHIKIAAGHYDQALRLLRRQAAENMVKYPGTGALRKTGELILTSLNTLSDNISKRHEIYLPQTATPRADRPDEARGITERVLCSLSADQLGVLLKAAFESGIIVGSSFRKICKAIIPFLSTPWKAHISWETVRSNSGRPEKRDKDIVIQLLEKMIGKIKDNR